MHKGQVKRGFGEKKIKIVLNQIYFKSKIKP
jgi:hypothetical protein